MTKLTLANGQVIDYHVVRKPYNKHMYLSIKNQQVQVRSNNLNNITQIEQFIYKHSKWISNQLTLIQNLKIQNKNIKPKNCYLFGKFYVINYEKHAYIKIKIKVTQNSINVYKHEQSSLTELQMALNNFYKEELKKNLLPKIQYWSTIMQLYPNKISFRNNKSIWGSCNAKNNLSFNIHLAQLDQNLIEYVIIHELAHIRYKHHQKPFWQLVAQYLPNYDYKIKSLRKFEKLLKQDGTSL